jgi:hypothetical protein
MSMRIKGGAAFGGLITLKYGDTPVPDAQILTEDPYENYNQFGFSMASTDDNTVLVIGAMRSSLNDPYANRNGAVYVYDGPTWSEVAAISTPSAYMNYEQFGYSLDIDNAGTTMVIAAKRYSGGVVSFTGAAYVYTKSGSTWSLATMLEASDNASYGYYAYFGQSVSITDAGDYIAVGRQNAGTTITGRAYVYYTTTTTFDTEQILTDPDAFTPSGSSFSREVCLSGNGDYLLVGAPNGKPTGTTTSGSVYLYTKSGSTYGSHIILGPTVEVAFTAFGESISTNTDASVIAIGAPGASSDEGAVYIFTGGPLAWTQQTILTASDGAAGWEFGRSVSLSADGNTLVVGAPGADSDTGAEYLFKWSGSAWDSGTKIVGSNSATGDRLGFSTAVSGNGEFSMSGAPNATVVAEADAGTAYAFKTSAY